MGAEGSHARLLFMCVQRVDHKAAAPVASRRSTFQGALLMAGRGAPDAAAAAVAATAAIFKLTFAHVAHRNEMRPNNVHTLGVWKKHTNRLLFYVCVCLWAGITVNHERPRRKRVAQNDDKETKKNNRQRCNGGGNT